MAKQKAYKKALRKKKGLKAKNTILGNGMAKPNFPGKTPPYKKSKAASV